MNTLETYQAQKDLAKQRHDWFSYWILSLIMEDIEDGIQDRKID
ncbi:MAG: hypothetical protein ACRC31_00430 [Cetobacterium sp.]